MNLYLAPYTSIPVQLGPYPMFVVDRMAEAMGVDPQSIIEMMIQQWITSNAPQVSDCSASIRAFRMDRGDFKREPPHQDRHDDPEPSRRSTDVIKCSSSSCKRNATQGWLTPQVMVDGPNQMIKHPRCDQHPLEGHETYELRV